MKNNLGLDVIIIGLGSIGLHYDYLKTKYDNILSHSNSFYKSKKFNLLCGIDKEKTNRKKFEKKFKLPTFETLSEIKEKNLKTKIACISVPTNVHKKVFLECLNSGISNIIIEKPLGKNFSEAKFIKEISKEKNFLVLPNYMRRFNPNLINLKKMIQYNKINHINLNYSGDFRNNSSHLIDLSLFFLNQKEYPDEINIFNFSNKQPSFVLKFNSGISIVVNSIQNVCYEVLEMDLILEDKRIKLIQGGRTTIIQKAISDKLFKNYKILKNSLTEIDNQFHFSQKFVVDYFYNCIKNNKKFDDSLDDAVKTSWILEEVSKKIVQK